MLEARLRHDAPSIIGSASLALSITEGYGRSFPESSAFEMDGSTGVQVDLPTDSAELFVGRQQLPDLLRQLAAADRDGRGGGLHRMLHDGLVPVSDEQDADGGRVPRSITHLSVDGLHVELQLDEVTGFEPAELSWQTA